MLTVERNAALALLTRRQDSREHAIELFDRKILAHVAIRAGVESRVHLLFVVADAGENNDRECRIQFPHERDERDSIHLRHLKIDNRNLAIVL